MGRNSSQLHEENFKGKTSFMNIDVLKDPFPHVIITDTYEEEELKADEAKKSGCSKNWNIKK